jgi:hypothetical protein
MCRKIWIVCVVMGLSVVQFSTLDIQSQVMGKETSEKVDYKLVWEKEFKKEIQDVRFGETEDGKLYPKIVMFEDEVRFYDEKESLLDTLSLEKQTIKTWVKDSCIAIKKYLKVATKSVDGIALLTLYSDKGKKLYEIESQLGYEVSPYFFFSENGYAVEVEGSSPVLTFYDRNGKKIKRVTLFEESKLRWFRAPVACDFSKDGEFVAALVSERAFAREEDQYPWLLLFSGDGREIWRKKLEITKDAYTYPLFISPKGSYIAVGEGILKSIRMLLLFGKSGDLIGKYKVGADGKIGPLKCGFSPNEKYFCAGILNQIYLIDLQSGKQKWFMQFPWVADSHEPQFRWLERVEIGDNGEVYHISKLRKRVYRVTTPVDLQFILLDKDGEIMGKKVWDIKEARGLKIGKKNYQISSWGDKNLSAFKILRTGGTDE